MREFISYFLLAIIGFYVFPLFCSKEIVDSYFLTAVNPIVFFICSYCYGAVRPHSWWFPISLVMIFIPTLFIYYDKSDWYYLVGYAGVSIIGSAIGWFLYKKREELEAEEREKRRNRQS